MIKKEQNQKYKHSTNFHLFPLLLCVAQGISELLDKLVEVTLQQPYMGGMVPEPWLNFERSILRYTVQNTYIFIITIVLIVVVVIINHHHHTVVL